MVDLCRRIASSRRFQNAILVVIIANAILIGLETSPTLWERYGGLFDALNFAVQVVFVAEMAVRLLAQAPRVHRFFLDGWNVFDFTIVALSLLPVAGPFATVARLARLLRALRVVSALPELRLIVATMLRSIPSLANVVALLGLILYVYAVVGVHLFGGADPGHWGTLPRAGLTLFEILTLEGWVDLMDASLAATPWAWVYYVSFVVLAVFVVINLFIAIVINNLETAKREQKPAAGSEGSLSRGASPGCGKSSKRSRPSCGRPGPGTAPRVEGADRPIPPQCTNHHASLTRHIPPKRERSGRRAVRRDSSRA
ncbi:MAG: ion transporter [Holophagales bacterium]|nr:ion transporter [Holophagales bacterium]